MFVFETFFTNLQKSVDTIFRIWYTVYSERDKLPQVPKKEIEKLFKKVLTPISTYGTMYIVKKAILNKKGNPLGKESD